jgi:hypothetical protein
MGPDITSPPPFGSLAWRRQVAGDLDDIGEVISAFVRQAYDAGRAYARGEVSCHDGWRACAEAIRDVVLPPTST